MDPRGHWRGNRWNLFVTARMPLGARLARAYVPEGLRDRSLARSAWDSATQTEPSR
jgi:hypothetical protein